MSRFSRQDNAGLVEYLIRWHPKLLPTGVLWLLERSKAGTLPTKRTLDLWLRYLGNVERDATLRKAWALQDHVTIQRVIEEHLLELGLRLESDLAINRCPQCRGVARTPRAKQCRWCGADWHG